MSQIYFRRAALSAVLCLFSLPLLFSATILVTSSTDSGAGSLRQAVADAAAGDTIRFSSTTLGETFTLASEIVIDKALYIRGNGIGNTNIDGGGAYRAFNVMTDGDVYIGILSIENCATMDNGGAIINPTGQLHLDGVRISESSAAGTGVGNGGGAVANSGTLFVTASQFINNSATGAAGSGGAILQTGGLFAMAGTSFTGNTAMRAGGAIEMADGPSSGRLSRVTMTGNTTGPSPGNGGAVHITGPSNLTVIGGTYSGNTASREGGALWNGSGTMTVRGAMIDGNTASGDAADDGGGGIFNNGGTLRVFAGTTITNNVADGASGSGGGIFNAMGGNLQMVGATVSGNTANRAGGGIEDASGAGTLFTVGRTTISDNEVFTSPGNGGGIHIGGAGNLSLFGSTVSGNTAGAEGGGVWNDMGTTVVSTSMIMNNTASGAAANQGGGGLYNNEGGGKIVVKAGTVVSGNTATGAAGSGGGILNDDGGTLEVYNATISTNTANRAGGGIEDASGDATLVIIANSDIDSNEVFTSPGNGGGIHVGGSGNITFRSGRVRGNVAGAEGGGIWIGSGTLSIGQGVLFEENVATGDDPDQGGGALYSNGNGTIMIRNNVTFTNNSATGASGSGGAILNNVGATLTMDRAIFTGNTANRAGGAIEDVSGDDGGFSGFRVINSTFTMNSVGTAPGNGGAIHISGDGDLLIRGGEFTDNTAGSEGGAVWNNAGTMKIEGAAFTGNIAEGAGADNGGGAIFNNGGTMNVIGGTVMNNQATGASGSGGGLLTTGGSVSVIATNFSGNLANRAGGAVEQIDGLYSSTNVTYNGNTAGSAPGNGGAFHVTGMASTAIFNGGTVTGNVATNEGAGLWNQIGTMMTVDGVDISGNMVTGMAEGDAGSGIFNNGGITDVMNSTISGNSIVASDANTDGGGIFNKAGGDFTLTNSTVSGNTTNGNGGGISNDGTFAIVNSTIAFNEGNAGGGYFQDAADASLDITGSIISDNTSAVDGGQDFSAMAGTVTSGGFNLLADDELDDFPGTADDIEGGDADLSALADNGGATMTHAPGCDGDAINAGNPADNSPDQAGQPLVGTRDIGAFEVQTMCPNMRGVAGPNLYNARFEADIKVFPNPTSEDALNVRIPTDLAGEAIMRLIDADGRIRATSVTRAGGLIRIPLGNVPNGAYTLQVINGDNVSSRRVLKQR